MKKVAIFDIDGTIFRSSLLRELLESLISFGVFPRKAQDYYVHAYINWLDRKGPYEKYLAGIIKAFQRYIKGVPPHIVWDVAQHVIDFHQNRLYKFTRDLVRELKKKNYYLIAISGSPFEIVDIFAKNLGFNKTYGRIFEIDKNERFTGKIRFKDIVSDKGKILKRAVKKENLTLNGSVGVGDTDSDIAFLKMVERPVAFNPNLKLYQYAKRVGWEIIVERKDVIYNL
jgi:HAD superfamily hydrolase (TIGR01490 family)